MRQKIILIAIFAHVFNIFSFSQVHTIPALPIADQTVSIIFNSAEDSRLGFFTDNLYAHTGVAIEGKGNWQNIIGGNNSWGNNNLQPKLNYLGDGIYELKINPDINTFYSIGDSEIVYEMCFVFRSSDGSQQTNDIFIDVFQPGLSVSFDFPSQNQILELTKNYALTVNTTEIADLQININNNIIAQSRGKHLETSYSFSQAGNYTLIAIAKNNNTTVSDTVNILVRSEVIQASLPNGAIKGITYPTNESVRLVLWAPYKKFVFLLCELNNWTPQNNFQMKKDGNYFWIEIDTLETNKEYPFQYYIDGKIKIADPYTNKILDPWYDIYIDEKTYPGLIPYPTGKTEGIVSVFKPGQETYKWKNPTVTIPPNEQMVIYELLVRDFTEEHSFKAVREKLDYLKDLNINVLELLPINEFEGNSSWGYNPSFFFATDKYYGPTVELKKLIDECHARGIAVVIDMVLNHSYGQSPFVQMYMDNWKVTPDNPWHNEKSNFSNPNAQWGYDFNHNSNATRELVDSINSFWLNEFNLSGFRFDFTKGFSNTPYGPNDWGSAYDADRVYNLKRMADEIWKRKPETLVILEHLADNTEEKVLADYGMLLWGNMNHNYSEAAMGYNDASKSNLSWGYYANRNWQQPNLVTYQESHDEERLAYKTQQWGNSSNSYNIKELDVTLNRLKLTSVFHIPLPGPKMIWQFGELGYDYSIEHNGRTGEKPILWEYFDDKKRTDLFKVIASLNFLKQRYEEFTTNEVILSVDGSVKTYKLSKNNKHIVVLGNFDVNKHTANIKFEQTGIWYNYFEQSVLNINDKSMNIELDPGKFLFLSTQKYEQPNFNILPPDENLEIKAYPNPVFNQLNISGTGVETIEIYNTSGRLITKQNASSYSKSNSLDVTQLAQGIYILVVNKTLFVRILKI